MTTEFKRELCGTLYMRSTQLHHHAHVRIQAGVKLHDTHCQHTCVRIQIGKQQTIEL